MCTKNVFKGVNRQPNGVITDDRFGWIGDSTVGTLLCRWPECGEEIFTLTHLSDDAANFHWNTHILIQNTVE